MLAGPGLMLGGIVAERKAWMIPDLTKEVFERYLGETFKVSIPGGASASLRLAKVVEACDKHQRDQRGNLRMESFSVLFEGDAQAALPQGIHTFTHTAMGETTLFATPVVSREPGVRCYEVVINRLIHA